MLMEKINSIGLYVHVPFCISKCHYCAFYSTAIDMALVDQYVSQICNEIQRDLSDISERVKTVFIGGGNPTSIGFKNLEKIVETLLKTVNIQNIEEFTIESNPETITPELVNLFRQIPKMRLSMGIQRLDDKELKILGRAGNMLHIENVLDMVMPELDNVSADIIMGVPECSDIAEKLDKFLDRYKLQHLSAYYLSVEDGTVLQSRVLNGELSSPDEIGPEEMFHVRDVFVKHGFEHYEISNYARNGFRCEHNIHYWNQGEYIGLGPSAVGTVMGKRVAQKSDLASWLEGEAADIEMLTDIDLRNEYVMLRLRLLSDGLNIEKLESKFGKQSEQFYLSVKTNISNGFLQIDNGVIKLTDAGIPFSNTVMGDLFVE